MSHPQGFVSTGVPDYSAIARPAAAMTPPAGATAPQPGHRAHPLTRHDVERIARTLGGVRAVVRVHPAGAGGVDRRQLAFHGLRLVLDPETPVGEVWVSSDLHL